MGRRVLACGLAALGVWPGVWGVLSAQPKPFDAAAAFGARESVLDLALSPDGRKVAYITPGAGQGTAVLTLSLDDKSLVPKVAARTDGNPLRFRSCTWVSNTRLTCEAYGLTKDANAGSRGVLPLWRNMAFDADGANFKTLSARLNTHSQGYLLSDGDIIDWLPEEDGTVLMARRHLPDDRIGSRLGSSKEGLGVDWIDTRTGASREVEPPVRDARQYITDGHGTVRIMATAIHKGEDTLTGNTLFSYRVPGSREWAPLGVFHEQDGTGFAALAVDRDLSAAYGLKKLDGRFALYTVKLDGSLREALVYARPDVDVQGVKVFGRGRHVVGATYVTDRAEVHYLDPKLETLMTSLRKAIPQPLLGSSEASLDETRLLLWAGGDSDPGVSYLFDRTSHQLNTFLVMRAELEGVKLALVRAIRYPAADGTAIPAYLTLPPGQDSIKGLPAIVLPHGGPSARDTWRFDWLAQFFAARGYAVLQPNYRGSSGYGDAWEAGNAFQSWLVAIGDVIAAGHWLVDQGVPPGHLAIAGWSYGGYAALQSAVMEPDLFKAVIAVAPVTDLARLKEESRPFTNFQIVSDFVGSGDSMHEGSPAEHAGRIQAPVLLFHGGMDFNVSIQESLLMASRLKSAGKACELVTWENLDHQLEDSAARTELLRRSDAFLRKALGLKEP